MARNRRGFPIRRAANVAVAVPAFSPSDISGLVLWLDADAIEGLNDGDPITTWEDQSGNNNDATQSTGSAKPTYQTNELNGKPVVRLDGTDDYLDFGDPAALDFGTNSFSIFIVVKAADEEAAVFVKDNYAGDGNGILIFRSSSATDNYAYYNGTDTIVIGTADANYHLLEVVRSGTGAGQLAVFRDGVAGTPGTESRTLDNAINAYLGISNSVDDVFLNGDFAEIIIYDSALSQANRESVEDYISSKYGIF